MPLIDLVDSDITPCEVVGENNVEKSLNKAREVLKGEGLRDLTTIRDEVVEALNTNGASVEQGAAEIARVMLYADQDNVRFNAAKEVLKLHGAYGAEADDDKRVVFVIDGQVQMNNILNPVRVINANQD